MQLVSIIEISEKLRIQSGKFYEQSLRSVLPLRHLNRVNFIGSIETLRQSNVYEHLQPSLQMCYCFVELRKPHYVLFFLCRYHNALRLW